MFLLKTTRPPLSSLPSTRFSFLKVRSAACCPMGCGPNFEHMGFEGTLDIQTNKRWESEEEMTGKKYSVMLIPALNMSQIMIRLALLNINKFS